MITNLPRDIIAEAQVIIDESKHESDKLADILEIIRAQSLDNSALQKALHRNVHDCQSSMDIAEQICAYETLKRIMVSMVEPLMPLYISRSISPKEDAELAHLIDAGLESATNLNGQITILLSKCSESNKLMLQTITAVSKIVDKYGAIAK